jgi:hypothetical protein
MPIQLDAYKIYCHEQSDHYWFSDEFQTKEAAISAAKKIKKGPFGRSFMLTVIAPDGEVIKEL